MAEGKAMADKILRTIESIFKNDPELQEFFIIPTEDNTRNKSPVLYHEHNLGLESWCVKHVYQYACSVLFDHRELLSKQKIVHSKMEDLNYVLVGAILINADVTTFWNMKRELVELNVLGVENELHFSKIVLSYKSKSNETFSYRRWILRRILNKISRNDMQAPYTLLENEFAVINMASEKSPNNYHSWNHRIWCMENIATNNSISNLVYMELNYTQEWINSHVSEHAGYHYRQYLLRLVKEHKNIVSLYASFYNFTIQHLTLINDGDCSNLLMYLLGKQNRTRLLEETYSCINYVSILLYDLFILIDKLNKLFPEHESLFYHRRFLVYHLMKFMYEYHNVEFHVNRRVLESSIRLADSQNITGADVVVNVLSASAESERNQRPRLFRAAVNKVESCQLYKLILNAEKVFVAGNLDGSPGQVQVELVKKHKRWFNYIVQGE